MTVKSWTEEAEEAAAAMQLNSENLAPTGRSSGDEEAAKAGARSGGCAKGMARRGRLHGSSAEEGETTALLRRRRRWTNGAGREGIGDRRPGFIAEIEGVWPRGGERRICLLRLCIPECERPLALGL